MFLVWRVRLDAGQVGIVSYLLDATHWMGGDIAIVFLFLLRLQLVHACLLAGGLGL